MELDLFKSFVAVAEARSFSRAARATHSTQPTLSRQIARLESELGTKLFERYGRHVECTAAGQLLLPLAQAIITRTEDAVSLIREQAGAAGGGVKFGAVPSVMARLLLPSSCRSKPRIRTSRWTSSRVTMSSSRKRSCGASWTSPS